MLEPAVIVLRLVQYAGAMILLGSSLFFIYALPRSGMASAAALGWPKRLLAAGAFAVLLGSLFGLIAQTAVMAGSLSEGFKLGPLAAVASDMGLGRASLARAGAAGLAVAAFLTAKPGRGLWGLSAGLGAGICASFAWMGHGAATEGAGGLVHLGSDILHALSAAVWIGALVAFLILLSPRAPGSSETHRALHDALQGFSGIGSGVVAMLVATGVINSWFLVGPTQLDGLWTTSYGQLLLAKLTVFVLMLTLAAANRFRLAPGLRDALDRRRCPTTALARLRASLVLETTAAFTVLMLVAWMGTLAPVSAQ